MAMNQVPASASLANAIGAWPRAGKDGLGVEINLSAASLVKALAQEHQIHPAAELVTDLGQSRDFLEPEICVKRHSGRVLTAHASPDRTHSRVARMFDDCIHQCAPHALAPSLFGNDDGVFDSARVSRPLPELIVTRKSHHAPVYLRHEEARAVANSDSHFGLAPLLRIEGDRGVPNDRILDLGKPSGITFDRWPDNHGSARIPSGVEIRATRRFPDP